MRIYADTSFLVALLCATDKAHASSRAFFIGQGNAEWLTSEWSLLETRNALRQLCLARPGPNAAQAESKVRLLKHWHQHGPFKTVITDNEAALFEAQQFSTAHGTSLRMRSADVLHVALLEEINPDLFVTRDKDQHALALARAFPCRLVP